MSTVMATPLSLAMSSTSTASSAPTASSTTPAPPKPRGAFILFEGLDRTGKTTQSLRLASHLNTLKSESAQHMRFPDRTTPIGLQLDSYLRSASECEDHAIHLLFAANRWEAIPKMLRDLKSGKHVIVDRYSYSGAAFSASKGIDLEWCMAPERGLPAPDVVIYLSISPEAAEKRGGFGMERYEKKETQARVTKLYDQLKTPTWQVLDADMTMDALELKIREIASKAIASVQTSIMPDKPSMLPNELGAPLLCL